MWMNSWEINKSSDGSQCLVSLLKQHQMEYYYGCKEVVITFLLCWSIFNDHVLEKTPPSQHFFPNESHSWCKVIKILDLFLSDHTWLINETFISVFKLDNMFFSPMKRDVILEMDLILWRVTTAYHKVGYLNSLPQAGSQFLVVVF